MAEYIDFQRTIIKKNYLENLPALLSIFIIPKGHKYNDDYDILELRKVKKQQEAIARWQNKKIK